jgi:hypothetical protein
MAAEKSSSLVCEEDGLFKRASARTVASSMAKHAPVFHQHLTGGSQNRFKVTK